MDECLWLITNSWHLFFPENLCVCNLLPQAEPEFIRNTEDKPLFQPAARILGKMADEATNQTSTGSNLD